MLKCSFRPRKCACELQLRLPAESGSDFKKRQLNDLDFSIQDKKNVDVKVEMIPNTAGWGWHMMGAVNKVNKQNAE